MIDDSRVAKSNTKILGDIRLLYSHILVPQFLVLVSLTVLSILIPSNIFILSNLFPRLTTQSLFLFLCAGAALFVLNIYYSAKYTKLYLKIVRMVFLWVGMFLLIGTIGFKLSPIANFFLPLMINLALLLPFRFNIRQLYFIAAPLLFFTVVLIFVNHFRLHYPLLWAKGPLLLLLGFAISLISSVLLRSAQRHDYSLKEELSQSGNDEELVNAATTKSSIATPEATFLSDSMAEEFRWRFIPLAFIVGGLVLLFAISTGNKQPSYYIAWVMILLAQVTLFWKFTNRRDIRELQGLWLLSGCGLFIWWMNAYVYGVIDLSTSEIGLLLIMLGLSTVPWIKEFNIAITVVFSIFAATHIIVSNVPILMFLLDSLIIVFCMYRNARHYVRFSGSILLPKLLAITRGCVETKKIVEHLAESLRLLGDARRILVCYAKSSTLIIGQGQQVQREIDPLYVQGLTGLAKESGSTVGLLFSRQFRHQFDPALYYWFGELPNCLYFCRVSLVSGEKDEVFYLFMPVSFTIKLVGLKSFQELASSLLQNIGLKDSAHRAQHRASQVVVSGSGGVDAKEEDLNHLIHLVNNSAQDLSIVTDNCRAIIHDLPKISVDQASLKKFEIIKEHFVQQVSYLDGALRNLSASVSDVKWLREIGQIKNPKNTERVNILSSLEEAASFADFKIRKSGAKLEQDLRLDQSIHVNVLSREFFEASLRTLLKVLTRNFGPDDLLKVTALVENSKVIIKLGDTSSRKSRLDDYFLQGRDIDSFRAIRNFFTYSDVQIDFNKGFGDVNNVVQLTFKIAPLQEVTVLNQGWILLVDDKAEIVTFYSSVAEALGLSSGCATGIDKAKELLEQKGQPLLVLTDLQLDQENGLDLVRFVRTQYGDQLPVVVVSGNVEDNLKNEIFAAGASKYLTKPVGRRKLFFEIQELLNNRLNSVKA